MMKLADVKAPAKKRKSDGEASSNGNAAKKGKLVDVPDTATGLYARGTAETAGI
jgi:hypothetical protein